jgi:enamine deaminase RidA (YjgF/YER057c/UK114 family)
MAFSTIATPEARPVANYKMATRMEGGRLLYISGQVAWDTGGSIVGKGDVRAQARQTFQNLRRSCRRRGATSGTS